MVVVCWLLLYGVDACCVFLMLVPCCRCLGGVVLSVVLGCYLLLRDGLFMCRWFVLFALFVVADCWLVGGCNLLCAVCHQ